MISFILALYIAQYLIIKASLRIHLMMWCLMEKYLMEGGEVERVIAFCPLLPVLILQSTFSHFDLEIFSRYHLGFPCSLHCQLFCLLKYSKP